jgi:hypothetical protein
MRCITNADRSHKEKSLDDADRAGQISPSEEEGRS